MPQQKVWKINGSTFLYTLLLLAVQVQKTDTETLHYTSVHYRSINFINLARFLVF